MGVAANMKKFGFRELVAIGIGGMIGGGIFSVLGLAVKSSGHAAPLAFLIAGLIALFTGYSYVKLALHFHSDGASFTYLERAFPQWPNTAGILGWLVVVGYIGTLALYTFTFGIYAADLIGLADDKLVSNAFSLLVLSSFVLINLNGVSTTGITEDIIVYAKLVLLLVLGLIGLQHVNPEQYTPIFNQGKLNVFTAAAIIFVAFEGFQLITNAVCETERPEKNIPRSIYAAIIVVSAIYILLALMSVGTLTPDQFEQHGEYALAVAIMPSTGIYGRVLVDIAAVLATGSAINATLFGASKMTEVMATEKMLPTAFSFRNQQSVPWIAVIVIAALSGLFIVLEDLETIAIFSSMTFLLASLGVAIANLKLYKQTQSSAKLILLAITIIAITVTTLITFLLESQPEKLIMIAAVYVAIIMIELGFSRRRLKFNIEP